SASAARDRYATSGCKELNLKPGAVNSNRHSVSASPPSPVHAWSARVQRSSRVWCRRLGLVFGTSRPSMSSDSVGSMTARLPYTISRKRIARETPAVKAVPAALAALGDFALGHAPDVADVFDRLQLA